MQVHNFILFSVPCPPASVAVVDRAVIWQPPKCPNGNLLGYDIRVYSASNIGQAQIINNVDVNSMHHKLFSIPDGNDLRVQVIITVITDVWLLTGMILLGSWKDCSWSR